MGIRFKPGGVNFHCDGDGVITEEHTKTCSHCQNIVKFPSLKRMMEKLDVCRSCMGLICVERCYGKPCVTWLQQCDIEEALYQRKFWGSLSEF